jgi:hypothetical protein
MRHLPIRRAYLAPTTLLVAALLAGCGYGSPRYDAPAGPARVPAAVHLTLTDAAIEIGQATAATAAARDQYDEPVAADGVRFMSSAPEVAAVSPTTGAIVGLSAGTARITATIAAFTDTQTVTVVGAPLRINEVRPAGGTPAGWVELFNPTDADIDLAGWQLTGGDVSRSFTLPVGAKILAHGYRVVNEVTLPGGLASADAVHLFSRYGVQVDSFIWFTDPGTSYGRCPEGSGPFVVLDTATRATTNSCPSGR